MAASAPRYVSLEEYERLERTAETKSEWFDGEILAMAGASFAHIEICSNLFRQISIQLGRGPCRAYVPDLRVRTQKLRAYPDLVVTCGEPQLDPDSPIATITDPVAIFEVLSPSTAAFDRGDKFEEYRTLASLRDYVLVAQDRMYIEHYARDSENGWILVELRRLDAELALSAVDVAIPLSQIYERITFIPRNVSGTDFSP